MPRIPIVKVGSSTGIFRDPDPHSLPPEAWSLGSNVRFQDGKVVSMAGHKAVFDPPSVAPYWALSVKTATDHFWLYTSLTQAYALQNGVHTEITQSTVTYSATANDLWLGGILGGIPVITNGVDDPQSWSPISASQKLVDLPNWPANTSCKVIRPFKNFLVALNITLSGTVSPHKVKWSDAAAPGAVPSSWDETDATKLAGENELDDVQAGLIRDGLALGSTFMIYKDHSTWSMNFIGGQNTFDFDPLPWSSGILTAQCVQVMPKNSHHFVATADDLIIHDGVTIESVITHKWRRHLQATLDSDNFDRSYVWPNHSEREMWFCYPEAGSTLPNKAIIYSTEDGSITERDIQGFSFIAGGVISDTVAGATWDSVVGTWDSQVDPWDTQSFRAFALDGMAMDPTNTKLFHMDQTNQADGANVAVSIERQGLTIAGVDRNQAPIVNIGQRKLVKRIWPRASGGPFDIRLGSQEDIDGPITFAPAQSFDPSTDKYLDFIVSGRLLATQFSSFADVSWELEGYDLEIELLGDL